MNIRPNIWLTADTHFGHSKMFEEWDHREPTFNEDLVTNWNNLIHKHDVVLHLGDLTMTNKDATQKWTLQLKGEKYLIRGNHDGNSDTWYRDCGFEVIPNAHKNFYDKHGREYHVLFTHEPVMKLPDFWFNIHGHLHGNNHRNIKSTNNHVDVGVDPMGMKPVQLMTLLDLFKKMIAKDEL